MGNQWGQVPGSLVLSLTLDPLLVTKHRERLLEQQLVVVARREKDGVDPWKDPTICIGEPILYDNLPRRSISLGATMRPEFVSHVVRAELFVLPPGANVAKAKTLSDIVAMDGLMLDSKGTRALDPKTAS